MKKLLVVTGSVRRGRAADNVLAQVQEELKNYQDFEVSVADLKDLPMPFFDSEIVPSAEGFVATDKNVKRWTALVEEADIVLIITPEYNYSIPAVLKNAIDWVYAPWKDKPVAFISYGWGAGGGRAVNHLRSIFENPGAKLLTPEANLYFTKQINVDGSAASNDAKIAINNVLKALDS